MALIINCAVCRKFFPIPERASTRIDLEQVTGEYFKKICPNCVAESEYHVNDVMAESNRTHVLISSVVGLVVMFGGLLFSKPFITLGFGGAIMTAGWIAGSGTSSFNGYKTTRSRDVAKNQQIREQTKYAKGDSNFNI